MEKLKPFIENILFDTIVPILYVTEQDLTTFHNDPIEFIRNQYDFTETLFQPKNVIQDLLRYICKHREGGKKKSKAKPEYLFQFLQFAVQNLTQYADAIQKPEGADWRIKEALMYSIGVLCDEIEHQKELKGQMEQMLTQFVLPELKSEQPFMRLRACQTYGVYGDYKFKDLGHIQAFCEGVFNNMADNQPLPVRFYAACALEKILTNQQAVKYLRPGIDTVL